MSELPSRAVTLADVRRALDDALLAGDVHRARRLNALAAELEALGLTGKGERDAEEGWDHVGFVLSLNLHRRHLSESQRAMVAARIANLGKGRQDSNASIEAFAVSQPDAAKQLNVSRPSVQRARVVLDKGTAELADAVERGDVSVSAAATVAKLPADEQRDIVALGPAAVASAASEMRRLSVGACAITKNL